MKMLRAILRGVSTLILLFAIGNAAYGQTFVAVDGGRDFVRNEWTAGLQGQYVLPPIDVRSFRLRNLLLNPAVSYLFEPDLHVVDVELYVTKVAFWESGRPAWPYAGIGPAVRYARFSIPGELAAHPEVFDNEDLDIGLALKGGAFLPRLLDRLRPFAELEVVLADGISPRAAAGLVVTVGQ